MNYAEYDAPLSISDMVKCFWTLQADKEQITQRQNIVPDGCMEMIFHIGDLYKQYTDADNYIEQPRCFVFGQITKPLEIEPSGVTNIFAVRFYPNGFMPFATMSIKDMQNKAIALQNIYGNISIALEKNILSASSVQERIQIVEKFLADILKEEKTIDKVVRNTLDLIYEVNGQVSVEELSKKLNVNSKQIERKLIQSIGLSPKQLTKTIRLHATLKTFINRQNNSLTDLAYEGGYYDQAHFIKCFKELTGLTPKEFYGEQLSLSVLMNK